MTSVPPVEFKAYTSPPSNAPESLKKEWEALIKSHPNLEVGQIGTNDKDGLWSVAQSLVPKGQASNDEAVGKVWAQIVADNTASGAPNPNAPASANIPGGNLNVVDAGTWVFVTGQAPARPTTLSIPKGTPNGPLKKGQQIEAGHGVVDGRYYLTLNSNGDLALYSVNSQNPNGYNTTPVWSYSSKSLVPLGETASSVTWDGFAFNFTAKNSSVSNGVPLTSMPNSGKYFKENNKSGSLTFV
jgi:hypothetical protein